MRTYELMFIIDPNLEADKINENLSKIQEIITAKNGIIRKWERWGKRRLVYEIQGKQYGYYVLLNFDSNPADVAELDRLIRINPLIIRHLLIILDPKRVPEVDTESVKSLGANREVHETPVEAAVAADIEAEVVLPGVDLDSPIAEE